MEELPALEQVKLDNPYGNHCRNLWLYSFYFAGMRVGDVLRSRWNHFQDGRFQYGMNKNGKVDSLKILPKVEAILQQYESFRQNADDFVFPELKRLNGNQDPYAIGRTIASRTSAIDKCLRTYVANAAGITTKLTMHIARHTFATLSGTKIDIRLLQKLYRHTSITTTIGYQSNFIHDDVDDALEAVLNQEAKKVSSDFSENIAENLVIAAKNGISSNDLSGLK